MLAAVTLTNTCLNPVGLDALSKHLMLLPPWDLLHLLPLRPDNCRLHHPKHQIPLICRRMGQLDVSSTTVHKHQHLSQRTAAGWLFELLFIHTGWGTAPTEQMNK